MRVDGAAFSVVTVGLFALAALWAIDDLKHHGPFGCPRGEHLALDA